MRNRPANIDDLFTLVSLVRACIRHMDEHGINQWDNIYPTKLMIHKDIESKSLHVFEDGGKVCGMVAINEDQPAEYRQINWNYDGKILVVHRLAIAAAYQRKKLATRLMGFAEDFARIEGYDAVRLDAFTQNPGAVALYTRLNYRNAGTVAFRKGAFFCFEKLIRNQTNRNL
jgi:ribosomal protein S18 acetylase RimI-like enzyme